MTSADSNDLMPAQKKLEWATPKISVMEALDTDRKQIREARENGFYDFLGPS